MTHLGADLLMGYARRTLDAEALLLADDHLSGCRECRGRLTDDDGLTATVRSLGRDLAAARHAPTGHLPYDQIEARAEGRLRGAAREVAETHLEHCAPCTVQTRDLEGFATAFRDARPRATVAGAAAAAAENDAAPGAASGTAVPIAARETTAVPGDDPASEPATSRSTTAGAPAHPRSPSARPAMRVSDEALAEDAVPRPAMRGGAIVFSAARDGEEKSRAGTVALVIVGAAILVAVGYGGRASWQRLTALKGRVQELERRNESLQAQAGDPAAPAAAPEGTTASGDAATGAAAVVPAGAGADVPAGAAGESAEAPGAAPAETPADVAAPLAARRALTIQDKKGPVGLDPEGDLVGFDGLPVAAGKVLAAALRRGGVDVPDEIRALAAPRTAPADADLGPEPTAAGAQEIAMTLATAAGTFVRSTRPVLSWGAVEGAKAYRVAVFDAAGTVIARGGPMRATTWTVSRALQRGTVYEWRVIALRTAEAGAAAVNAANPGPPETAAPASDTGSAAGAEVAAAAPAPTAPRGPVMERFASGAARFKVLGQDEATALERVLRAAPGSRLVAGVMAARAGLLDDAERDLRALAKENSDSGVARGLLASVEAARLP